MFEPDELVEVAEQLRLRGIDAQHEVLYGAHMFLTRLRLRPTRCIGCSQSWRLGGLFFASWRALREINPAFRWRCA